MRSLLCGALVLLSARAGLGDGTNGVFLKGPYLQGPGADTMTIKWEAPVNELSFLRYGLDGKEDHELRIYAPRPLKAVVTSGVTNHLPGGEVTVTNVSQTNVVYLYEAKLGNLRPGATYTYSAETGGVRSGVRKFRTFSAEKPTATLIAYGDGRSNPKTHAAVAGNFKRYSPDAILHTGDLVGDGRRYELWGREFFGPLSKVIDEIPMLPSVGNHEQDGTNYLFYLELPGKERWYSYDIGPVHVLALDYRLENGNDEQFAFAQRDLLGSKAPWKVVFMHYPVFNIGGHFTRWGHNTYLPLFHQAKVDLVVVGHSHLYERFRPVAGTNGAEAWPITHITTGGGGAGLAAVLPHPALASFYSTNHFVVLEATDSALKGRALTANNELLDSFELSKTNGQPSADYLAQVYPEEALKLTYEAAPSLTASLASVPQPDTGAPTMFTLHPIKGAEQPVPLEIELTPASAKYYKLEGGPLHVMVPGQADPEKVVWATVWAINDGQTSTASTGIGKALPHTLVFQGRLKAGGADTISYGQRSTVTDRAADAAKALKSGG